MKASPLPGEVWTVEFERKCGQFEPGVLDAVRQAIALWLGIGPKGLCKD